MYDPSTTATLHSNATSTNHDYTACSIYHATNVSNHNKAKS